MPVTVRLALGVACAVLVVGCMYAGLYVGSFTLLGIVEVVPGLGPDELDLYAFLLVLDLFLLGGVLVGFVVGLITARALWRRVVARRRGRTIR